MAIVVVGSVAIDDIITSFGKNYNAPGGSAVYFSLSASYFSKVKLVAVVGKDYPQKYIDILNSKGIDTNGIKKETGKTFRWKGSYCNDINNPVTINTQLNVFKDFKPQLPEDYKNEKIVFLANIDPDLQLEVLKQIKSPKIIAADTMNFWITSKKNSLLKVFKKIDISVINESEAYLLTKEKNIIRAAKHILSLGPKYVIIKKGEHGVLAMSKDMTVLCPAYPVEKVVDPTGAGDTFAGGFFGYVSKKGKLNKDIFKQAICCANIMASFNVEDFDIRGLLNLNKNLINNRINRFKNFLAFN